MSKREPERRAESVGLSGCGNRAARGEELDLHRRPLLLAQTPLCTARCSPVESRPRPLGPFGITGSMRIVLAALLKISGTILQSSTEVIPWHSLVPVYETIVGLV